MDLSILTIPFLKFLVTILLVTIANAESIYPNSTSSASDSSDVIRTNSLAAATSSTDTSWTSTCLYNPGFGYGDCNRPGDPVHGVYNNPYDPSVLSLYSEVYPSLAKYPSLAAFCSQMFVSDSNQFLATAAITTTTYPGYTACPDNSAAQFPCITYPATELDVYYVSDWSFTATQPCCLNCTLWGGNVQVYYWPTPAPTPSVSALVNSAGFTL